MVAVPPSLCLLSLYFSTLLNRELAVSLHKLRPKCIPTVDASFTSFISSIGQSLVLKSWSKDMTKQYYYFCRSICYQIVSQRRCDICSLLRIFFLVFALHCWSMKSSHFNSVHNNTKPTSNHIEDSPQSLFQFPLRGSHSTITNLIYLFVWYGDFCSQLCYLDDYCLILCCE